MGLAPAGVPCYNQVVGPQLEGLACRQAQHRAEDVCSLLRHRQSSQTPAPQSTVDAAHCTRDVCAGREVTAIMLSMLCTFKYMLAPLLQTHESKPCKTQCMQHIVQILSQMQGSVAVDMGRQHQSWCLYDHWLSVLQLPNTVIVRCQMLSQQ